MRAFPATAYILTLFVFGLLLGYAAFVPTLPFDKAIFDAIHGAQLPAIDPFMRGIQFLGETIPSIILPIPIVLWFWTKGLRREAIWFVTALVAVSVATLAIKELADRTRPNGDPFSFVSGHASYFTVFGGYLLFTIQKAINENWWLTVLKVMLVAFVVVTGYSRIYLGMHWPTDVVGGFLLGVLVMIPVLWRVDNPARIAT